MDDFCGEDWGFAVGGEAFDLVEDPGDAFAAEVGEVDGGADEEEADAFFLGLFDDAGVEPGVGDEDGLVGGDVAPDADRVHDVFEVEVLGAPLGVGEDAVGEDAVGDVPVEVDLVAGVVAAGDDTGEVAGVDVGDGDGVELGDGVAAEGFVLEAGHGGKGNSDPNKMLTNFHRGGAEDAENSINHRGHGEHGENAGWRWDWKRSRARRGPENLLPQMGTDGHRWEQWLGLICGNRC